MAHESKIAEKSDNDEDLAMIVRNLKSANAKKDVSNCFAGVASYQEAERYSSSDESEDELEDEFEAKSVGYYDLKDAFDKLYKMNIKVQKSNSSLSTIVKSLKGERDDTIKELKKTNSKQEKEIADCMERMKLMKEEIEQKKEVVGDLEDA
ncbi:hypothetical protein ACOSP7_026888 [Xanthoceras sorbifolium]